MNYISNAYTDIGIKKDTNQDSVLIMEAKTDKDNVFFSVLCDGMGGLANGEIASAAVIKAFAVWFRQDFEKMLYSGLSALKLEKAWTDILFEQNIALINYSRKQGANMGTTVAVLLIAEGKYYIINIGDSRVYVNNSELRQITEDQTFVHREVKLGNMTPEQAESDPRRNVLLQCIGASQFIEPDFYYGDAMRDDVFILCSDGFRHKVSAQEIHTGLIACRLNEESDIAKVQKELVELNKHRKETDNITVAVVRLTD